MKTIKSSRGLSAEARQLLPSNYKFLGAGEFTSAFLDGRSDSVRYLTNCKAKIAFSENAPSSRLFPKLSYVDWVEDCDGLNVIDTKLYKTARGLKENLKPLHYKYYQELRALSSDYKNSFNNINSMRASFKKIRSRVLREALIEAVDILSNYGYYISFEISPRNVAFDDKGNLKLIDCFFCREQLNKNRGHKNWHIFGDR